MELSSVLVTGANRGIGLEFVKQLIKLNPPPKYIFATYRDENKIQDLKSLQNDLQPTTSLYFIKLDITNEDDIKNARDTIEKVVKDEGLTLLINNAGTFGKDKVLELKKEILERCCTTNIIGTTLLTQEMYPLLKRSADTRNNMPVSISRAGVLTMISSMVSMKIIDENKEDEDLNDPCYISLRISKIAVNLSMKIMANEGKRDGILFILMTPGWTKTDFGGPDALFEPEESVGDVMKTLPKLNNIHNGVLMNRFAEPIPY